MENTTPGKFFFGFLFALVLALIAHNIFPPSPNERKESIRHFLLYPDKYEIHEIYRDSVLVNYEIICK